MGTHQLARASCKIVQQAGAMKPDNAALSALASFCDEAARLHGDDWTKVCAHVRAQVRALPSAAREDLEAAMERLLGYEPPPPDTPQVH